MTPLGCSWIRRSEGNDASCTWTPPQLSSRLAHRTVENGECRSPQRAKSRERAALHPELLPPLQGSGVSGSGPLGATHRASSPAEAPAPGSFLVCGASPTRTVQLPTSTDPSRRQKKGGVTRRRIVHRMFLSDGFLGIP